MKQALNRPQQRVAGPTACVPSVMQARNRSAANLTGRCKANMLPAAQCAAMADRQRSLPRCSHCGHACSRLYAGSVSIKWRPRKQVDQLEAAAASTSCRGIETGARRVNGQKDNHTVSGALSARLLQSHTPLHHKYNINLRYGLASSCDDVQAFWQ